MTLEVKQKHIEEGKRLNNICCPVALAFKELGIVASVGTFNTVISKKDWHYSFHNDDYPAIREFVRNFDDNKEVEPFTVEIKWHCPL